MCGPGFPLYFMLRNLGWLEFEPWWKALSIRTKRGHVLRLSAERLAIFNEVREWRRQAREERSSGNGGENAPVYCNKCGLCCEVASGMADFPAPDAVPSKWREIFANGLGRGHRFCAFLWEDNESGGGLCSIYSLRSNPCRLFDSEECEFFRSSSEPATLSDPRLILLVGRWLIKLVDSRKLPRVAARIACKRPKLLEFNRI